MVGGILWIHWIILGIFPHRSCVQFPFDPTNFISLAKFSQLESAMWHSLVVPPFPCINILPHHLPPTSMNIPPQHPVTCQLYCMVNDMSVVWPAMCPFQIGPPRPQKCQIWVTHGNLLCFQVSMLMSSYSMLVVWINMLQCVSIPHGTPILPFSWKSQTTITSSYDICLRWSMNCWKALTKIYAIESFSR
jgi:hypothetical protein